MNEVHRLIAIIIREIFAHFIHSVYIDSRVQISKANVFNRDCKKSAPELFKENRARYIQFISILASLFFHGSAYGFLKTGYNFICGKAVSRL